MVAEHSGKYNRGWGTPEFCGAFTPNPCFSIYGVQNGDSEKLKDPRWQKKRLLIMQRDQFKCQRCGNTEENLQVHHLVYEENREPWDIPDENLITYCQSRHDTETILMKAATKSLFYTLRTKFLAETVADISITFQAMDRESCKRFWQWCKLKLCKAYQEIPEPKETSEEIVRQQIDILQREL